MRPTSPVRSWIPLASLERLKPVRDIVPRRQVVQLSATPGMTAAAKPFQLEEEDRNDAALAPRLNAGKLLRWSNRKVERVLTTIDAPCVLMVANTVRTALEWFEKATKAQTAPSKRRIALERELFLVTGRMRPLDRQRTLDAVESRIEGCEPTLVVATQCVEAGVDWDFDAMISECASWDALVQRMGRVKPARQTRRRGVHHPPGSKNPRAGYGEDVLSRLPGARDRDRELARTSLAGTVHAGLPAGSSARLRAPASVCPGTDPGVP